MDTDGQILTEIIGETAEQDHPVGAQAIRYGTEKRAVRWGDHKLIESKWGVELYDLRRDPAERDNLADGLPDILTRLRPELPAERDASEANTIDEETRRQLESLGYMQ